MTPKEFLKLRRSYGLTQRETATLLGYKRTGTISDIERGRNRISKRNAHAIRFMFTTLPTGQPKRGK